LFGPPVLTLLAALLIQSPMTATICIYGGLAGGIVCGIMLGLKADLTWPFRFLLCLLFAAVMSVACISLCFVGCSLGSIYKLH
jgi:hypothetical protein